MVAFICNTGAKKGYFEGQKIIFKVKQVNFQGWKITQKWLFRGKICRTNGEPKGRHFWFFGVFILFIFLNQLWHHRSSLRSLPCRNHCISEGSSPTDSNQFYFKWNRSGRQRKPYNEIKTLFNCVIFIWSSTNFIYQKMSWIAIEINYFALIVILDPDKDAAHSQDIACERSQVQWR